jgi:Ni/Co efflux regulator RcnB
MFKHILAAAMAAALIAAPAAPALAQAATEKSAKAEKKAAKKLTPQQQKMKDCGAKWQDHKKEKKVKGQAEYRKFLSTCLKA